MRFITLALEGYGRFRERTVFEFDAGLTCIVGANESGKSTVLAALLDALYTLPTSTAQSVRERIHWGHPHGWTLELALELRGESIRVRKFHPVDEPRRRAEFVLADGSAKWRRLGAQLAPAPTDWRTDPYTQYDAQGRPAVYWYDGCNPLLFRPDYDPDNPTGECRGQACERCSD